MAYTPPGVVLAAELKKYQAAFRLLQAGLVTVDSLASDPSTDARAKLERVQQAARETIAQVHRTDLDGQTGHVTH
jgi:hypothetical protein